MQSTDDLPFPANLLAHAIRNTDTKITIEVNANRPRIYRNCIRPSMITKKTVKAQWPYLFNPEQLYAAKLIEYDQACQLSNANPMDLAGNINVTIGSVIHAIYLPQWETELRHAGISAKQEHPLISRNYFIEGQADLVLFDHEKKEIAIADLKTTGPKIIERDTHVEFDYLAQAMAYTLCLEELYPDYTVKDCHIVSLCKIPGTGIYWPVEEEIHKVKTPVIRQFSISIEELKNKIVGERGKISMLQYFKDLAKIVLETNKTLKKEIKGYDHWILSAELFNAKLVEMEKTFNG